MTQPTKIDFINTLHLLRVLTNERCQKVLQMISAKPMTVTELTISMRLDQSVVSQYLARMRKVKLVSTRRAGKNIYYSSDKEEVPRIHKYCLDILNK